MNVANAKTAWDESVRHIADAHRAADLAGDEFLVIRSARELAAVHGLRGDWLGYLDARRDAEERLDRLGDVPSLRMDIAYFSWPLAFSGRPREAQHSSEEALRLAQRLHEKELMITILESIGLALGLQDAHVEAADRFQEAMNVFENVHTHEAESAGGTPERYIRATLSFRGLVALRQGALGQAEADLLRAMEIKRRIDDRLGTPELHAWLGQLEEQQSNWAAAKRRYDDALALGGLGRRHIEATALAGLARVQARLGDEDAARRTRADAAALAERFQYNEVLAAVRLAQVTADWDDDMAAAAEGYLGALTSALLFNRFALDEVLAGRERGTPLTPIVATALERGAAGHELLERLHDRWRTGTLDAFDGPSVSPLQRDVTLVAAEQTARAREPGAGTPQIPVLEQLETALARF
jgi:tetratricopeptide (TPR) repeat protein